MRVELACPVAGCAVVAGSPQGLASHVRWHGRTDRLPPARERQVVERVRCPECGGRFLPVGLPRHRATHRERSGGRGDLRLPASRLVPGDGIVVAGYGPLEVLDAVVDGDRVQLRTGFGRRWWVLASTMFVVRRRAR